MIPIDHAASAALGWWRDLQPDDVRQRPGDRASLARLRRCAVVVEAMQDRAALALFQRLGATHPDDLSAVGLVAAVLAHVRVDGALLRPRLTVARQVGPDSLDKPETALFKPLRFRRLIEAEGLDERLTAFRRLVAQAGGQLHVRDLAGALLHWSEHRSRRWIYDYWNVAPDATNPPPATAAKDSPA